MSWVLTVSNNVQTQINQISSPVNSVRSFSHKSQHRTTRSLRCFNVIVLTAPSYPTTEVHTLQLLYISRLYYLRLFHHNEIPLSYSTWCSINTTSIYYIIYDDAVKRLLFVWIEIPQAAKTTRVSLSCGARWTNRTRETGGSPVSGCYVDDPRRGIFSGCILCLKQSNIPLCMFLLWWLK